MPAPGEEPRLIESINDMDDELKASINIIDRSAFFALIGRQTEPILANSELKPFFKLLPAQRHYLVKSMAIAPIIMDGDTASPATHPGCFHTMSRRP